MTIFAPGYPLSIQLSYDSVDILENIDATTNPGSSLSYDPGTDSYHYLWKTENPGRNLPPTGGDTGRWDIAHHDIQAQVGFSQ